MPWQHWTKALVWFDDFDISAFHSYVVVDLWHSHSEWHLLLSACVLECRREKVGAWIRATNEHKFLVKRGKSGNETREMLVKVYGDNAMKKTELYSGWNLLLFTPHFLHPIYLHPIFFSPFIYTQFFSAHLFTPHYLQPIYLHPIFYSPFIYTPFSTFHLFTPHFLKPIYLQPISYSPLFKTHFLQPIYLHPIFYRPFIYI